MQLGAVRKLEAKGSDASQLSTRFLGKVYPSILPKVLNFVCSTYFNSSYSKKQSIH